MRLLETAEDGLQAYDAMVAHRPDVMIVDVVMPGLGGLELIDRAAKVSADTEFIILSGYSRFNFAEQAVRLGVKRYLVKPLDEEDLASALADVVAHLDAKRRRVSRLATAKRQIARLRPLARQEALRSWIAAVAEGRAVPQIPQGLLGFPGKFVQIVVCRPRRECTPLVSCVGYRPSVQGSLAVGSLPAG